MAAPEFDPSQPFEDVEAPPFDPAAPHEEVGDQTTAPFVGASDRDVGPPSDGLPQDATNPVHASGVESFLQGANATIPFANAALDRTGGNADTLRAYRLRKSAAAQSEHPAAYLGGSLLGGGATAALTTLALPAKAVAAAGPMATRFLGNLIPAALQNSSNGEGITGTAKDVLAGELAALHLAALAKPLKSVGSIAQLPQKGAEAAMKWLGGTRIGKALGQGADESTGSMSSARTKELLGDKAAAERFAAKDIENLGDDLASRLARASTEGRAHIDNGDFVVPAKEFGGDFAKISRDAENEAVERFSPIGKDAEGSFSRVEQSDDPLGTLDKEIRTELKNATEKFPYKKEEAAPDDFAEMMALQELRRKYGVTPGEKTKEITELHRSSLGDNPNDPLAGPLLRRTSMVENGKPAKIHTNSGPKSGSRIGDQDKPDWWNSRWSKKDPVDSDHMSDAMWEEYNRKHGGGDPSRTINTTKMSEAESKAKSMREVDEMVARVGKNVVDRNAINAMARKNSDAETDFVLNQARKKASNTEGIAQDNIVNKWHLDEKAAKADKELKQLATGRLATEKLGTGGAAALGGLKGGLTGAFAGLAAGRTATRGAIKAVDLLAEGGQRLSKMKSWAESLADKETPIGRAAKWALSAEGDAMVARLAALADLPEAKEAVK